MCSPTSPCSASTVLARRISSAPSRCNGCDGPGAGTPSPSRVADRTVTSTLLASLGANDPSCPGRDLAVQAVWSSAELPSKGEVGGDREDREPGGDRQAGEQAGEQCGVRIHGPFLTAGAAGCKTIWPRAAIIVAMDATDSEILRLLRDDGRLSWRDLAAATDSDDFAAAAARLEPVIELLHLTGAPDYQLRVACHDTAELDALLRTLRNRLGAADTETTIVLRSGPPPR